MNNHLAGGPGRPDLTLDWRPILTNPYGCTIAWRARVRRAWRLWRPRHVYINAVSEVGPYMTTDRRGRTAWHPTLQAAVRHVASR